VCLTLGGCVSVGGKRVPTPIPTSTLAQNVRRAEEVGPGFLDFCPLHPGRAKARYDITLPGANMVPGWCRTIARRELRRDVVTFQAHWDAHSEHGPSGTATFTYAIKNPAPHQTVVPRLVSQGGTLPP
jgi:hypothetical protein